jgi:hypothetical protein
VAPSAQGALDQAGTPEPGSRSTSRRTHARPRRGVVSTCPKAVRPDQRELRVGAPDKARLSSRTTAVREDYAAPGTIEDAVVVIARGQRRDLR